MSTVAEKTVRNVSSPRGRYDVIIVGGGPAGLSAALILGRCRRNVLVCDAGNPRNAASRKLHGYLTRDGTPPFQFLSLCREELRRYPSVEFKECQVRSVQTVDGYFHVDTGDSREESKKLLLATGVIDELPCLRGIEELYGKSAFQCPYCDGWEVRDRKIAVYGKKERGLKLAKLLTCWSKDVCLFSDGKSGLSDEERELLNRNHIRLVEDEIECVLGNDGILYAVQLRNGDRIERDALFFNTPSFLRSELIQALGCEFSEKDGVCTGKFEGTDVSGAFAAGNILRDVQLAIVAAGEGARAAFGINTELTEESFR